MAEALNYGNAAVENMYGIGLTFEAERSCVIMRFEGSDSNDAGQMIERPGNGRGDTVTINFSRPNDDEEPKQATSNTIGEASSGSTLTDSIQLRYQKLDTGILNEINSQNLVSWSIREREIARLARQWSVMYERWRLNQLAGNTVVNANAAKDYNLSGCNATVAPDTNHWYFCQATGTSYSTEAAIAADKNAIITSRVIQEIEKRAGSKDYVKWPIAPCNTPYGMHYVLIVSPDGFQQIRDNSPSSDLYDLAKADIQGGAAWDSSPLVNGGGFIYSNTLVLRSDFLPKGITSGAYQANSRRAVFFGANAWHTLYGDGFTDGNHLGYSEHRRLREWWALADTISGVKVTIPNETGGGISERFASFVISHYSSI